MQKTKVQKPILKLFLLVTFLANISLLIAQAPYEKAFKKAEAWHQAAQYDSAIVVLKKEVRPLLKSTDDWMKIQEPIEKWLLEWKKAASTAATAQLYYQVAYSYFRIGNYSKALDLYEDNLAVWKTSKEPDTLQMGRVYQRSGEAYFRQGNFEKALLFFDQGINMFESSKKFKEKAYPELYYFKSAAHTQHSSFKVALEVANKGQQVTNKIYPPEDYTHAMFTVLFGNIYFLQYKYELALPYYEKALKHVLEGDKKHHEELGYYYNNLGVTYSKLKQFEKAKYHFEKGLEQDYKVWGENHPTFAFNKNNLGEMAFDQNQLKEAMDYYESSLQIFKNTIGEYNAYVPKVYNNIGEVCLKRGDKKQARMYFQKAICANTGQAFDAEKIDELPALDFYFHPLYLLQSLRLKGMTLLETYKTTKDENLITEVQYLYQTADSFIDQMRRTHIESADKINLSETVKGIYENALQSYWWSYQLDKNQKSLYDAFYFFEKSKAMVLLQSVSGTQALRFAGIPDSLQVKEANWKKEIGELEKQLFAAKQQENTEQINSTKEKLIEIKDHYQVLMDDLEHNFPAYYQLKYDAKMADVSETQAYLTKNKAALIEYFVGDSSLYVMLISPQSTQFFSIKNVNLLKKITDFRKQFFTPKNLASANISDFESVSSDLYELLLKEPLTTLENENIQRLIIIPDDNLAYLPFEILTKKSTKNTTLNYQNLPYLIKDYSLSYTWSATLLQRQEKQTIDVDYNYVGFAPIYDEFGALKLDSLDAVAANYRTRSNWQDLPAARKSVHTIADFLDGKAFLEKEARKENFFDVATNSRILHLAMHAETNDGDPLNSKLVFYGKKEGHLHALELYNTPIQTELAVLSACNTGFGQLKKGEGIMSLSRAFTWAGCPSVVMSQWSVPDAASGDIMVDFHRHLKEGQTKDEALRAAKLAYLENRELTPDRLHPFFWAGFVPLGDMSAMDLESAGFGWWFWAIGGLVLLLLIARKVTSTRNEKVSS